MPVKWTPEIDQILLLKILETSDVSPKCAEIAEKWPIGLDRPTPRAISERIFKIRSTAKASGTTGHFSISSAKSNAGTPRKNATNGTVKKALPKKRNGGETGVGKRKRGGGMSNADTSDDPEADIFESENNKTDISDDEAPTKKAKTNGAAKGKNKDSVKVKNEEVENKTIHDKGYENPFVEDDEVVDYA